MLYLSGDNNLSEEMVRALADIKLQGVPDGVNFTIQYDPQAPGFATYRYAITSKRLAKSREVENARKSEALGPLPIPEYLVRRLKNEDSASPNTLKRFIQWSAGAHPSKYRMLILSGHGSGAVGDFLSDSNARSGQPGSFTIPTLARALNLAKKRIHILGMDSCLMGMAEVGYQVRNRVHWLVGSEGFVPNAGWPYAHLMKQLKLGAQLGMAPGQLAKRLSQDVATYYRQYIPAGTSFDIASCDLSKLGGVAEAVKCLTEALSLPLQPEHRLQSLTKTVRDLVIMAHWQAQSYKFEQYTDLWDFCDRLRDVANRLSALLANAAAHPRGSAPARQAHARLSNISVCCESVKTKVDDMANPSGHTGPDFQHSHGLAVFFPWSTSNLGGREALKKYDKLKFAKDSNWSTFLKAYLTCSERGPRRGDGDLLRGTQRLSLAPLPRPGKHAEGASKHAEGASKFSDLILRLAPGGAALPWSMKNPPQGVRWPPFDSRSRSSKGKGK
jgi:hypothetical protein